MKFSKGILSAIMAALVLCVPVYAHGGGHDPHTKPVKTVVNPVGMTAHAIYCTNWGDEEDFLDAGGFSRFNNLIWSGGWNCPTKWLCGDFVGVRWDITGPATNFAVNFQPVTGSPDSCFFYFYELNGSLQWSNDLSVFEIRPGVYQIAISGLPSGAQLRYVFVEFDRDYCPTRTLVSGAIASGRSATPVPGLESDCYGPPEDY